MLPVTLAAWMVLPGVAYLLTGRAVATPAYRRVYLAGGPLSLAGAAAYALGSTGGAVAGVVAVRPLLGTTPAAVAATVVVLFVLMNWFFSVVVVPAYDRSRPSGSGVSAATGPSRLPATSSPRACSSWPLSRESATLGSRSRETPRVRFELTSPLGHLLSRQAPWPG